MVKIHLSKLLGEKRMTQLDLARKTGINKNAINELYHEFAVSVKLEHINKICEVLDCSSADLIEYIPDKQKTTGKFLIIEDHGNKKGTVR